jgi:Zn-dependent protease
VTATFRLGRVAGVEIGVNWTWLLVVALIAWSLAAGVFPETNPGLADGTYVAMAAVAVPVFFGCLLLHELGHAVTARRAGMAVEGITLWVFGGVARFSGAFPSANAELRIALAGPAVSLALGAVLLAAAILIPLPPAVDGVVHWLGYINLTLLAFNMLPALPLDGGRVLRAALWRARGDFLGATRTAVALGKGFGQALIVGGVVLVFAGAGIGGLWLAFIGWFLLAAAEAEGQAAVQHEALSGLRVADAMVAEPVTVPPWLSIERFLDDVVLGHRHTAYPVVEGDRPVGLVTFRDAAAGDRDTWAAGVVADRMRPLDASLVVAPQDRLEDVWPELVRSAVRRALVLDGGRLAGLLSATDVARILEVEQRRPHRPRPAAQSSNRNGGYSSRMRNA